MHSTTIHVYYTYTCELLGHLRGHNGKGPESLLVPPDDTRIISTGTDGAVYEFNLRDFHKVSDNVLKAVTYNCGVSDVATVWVGGNDRKLRQFERNKLQSFVEYNLVDASLISMSISQGMKLLFGGCEDGTLRVFNTYLGEKLMSANKEAGTATRSITIESHSTHTGLVTNLALAWDESLLVSVGEDGVVVFWDVVAPQRGLGKELQYSNELMMDRRELEEIAKQVDHYKSQLLDLKQRMLQQQSKRERAHESQIADLAKQYEGELEKQKDMLVSLEAEKSEQAIRFTEFMAELDEKSKRILNQTKEDYESKVTSLQERSRQLKSLIEQRRKEFEDKAAVIREEAAGEKTETQLQHKKRLEDLDEENHQLVLEKTKNDAETEAMSKLLEEDNDVDIISKKEDYEKRRREQEEELSAIQAANGAMLSKENLNRADLEAKVADVNEKLKQQSGLESQIESAKRDIDALTNEYRERGETIAEKERRIYDLKKKNQELEKFKFVLEYKIKELKAQIDPRDEEIRSTKEKLTNMGSEAEQYQQSSENLSLQIRSLRQKRAGNQKEIDGLHEKLKNVEEQQSRLWTEIANVYALCDESQGTPKERNARLKEMAKALLEKYTDPKPSSIQKSKVLSARTAADEVREYNRQRDHLERNLTSLKKKVNKDVENNRSDRSRITAENVILIREINDLRKEARTLAAKAGVVIEVDPTGTSAYDEEWQREIHAQNAEITRLQELSDDLEAQLKLKGIPPPQ
ncbi:WDdomain 65 [Angomonas deanei]|uniref:Uncharacterized protein n=1 Tax=Angomonas deanei TaxID=59799 RepID=A0A7G2CMD7_9TRYP|nr:WDdomain 65 [Angomonas deanei]CAD2219432.1 hypothetical protein, conserved [Angomonas deanei]|eukprot:EPY28933.1 WDdomain 65 [Angomonas deanei]